MTQGVKDLIDAIASGDSLAIDSAFNTEMASRISERLDDMRVEVAQNMFATESVQEDLDEAASSFHGDSNSHMLHGHSYNHMSDDSDEASHHELKAYSAHEAGDKKSYHKHMAKYHDIQSDYHDSPYGDDDARESHMHAQEKHEGAHKKLSEEVELYEAEYGYHSMVDHPSLNDKDAMKRSMHHNIRKEMEHHLKKAVAYHKDQEKHGGFELKSKNSVEKHAAFHRAQAEKAQHHLNTSIAQREKEKNDKAAPSEAEKAGTRHIVTSHDKEHHDKVLAHVKAHNDSIPRGQKGEHGIKATSFARAGGKYKTYLDGKKEHVDKIKSKLSESVEQIDELSKKTLSSYIHHSADDANDKARDIGHFGMSDDEEEEHAEKIRKRMDGIKTAVKKLTK